MFLPVHYSLLGCQEGKDGDENLHELLLGRPVLYRTPLRLLAQNR